MNLPIVYHPDYMAPLRPGHRFPMSKYGYLRAALVARGLLPAAGGYLAPAPATPRQVAAAHDLAYVERVAEARLTPEEARRIGLPSTPAAPSSPPQARCSPPASRSSTDSPATPPAVRTTPALKAARASACSTTSPSPPAPSSTKAGCAAC